MTQGLLVRGALLLYLVLPGSALAEEVKVFAATALKDSLEEAAKSYGNASHNTVSFTFGGSVEIGRQIATGAVADLFFSSGRTQIEALDKLGLVTSDSRLDFLSNPLVVITPASSNLQLKGSPDLKSVPRIAVPDAKAGPSGEYIRAYLDSRGLLSDLEPRFIILPTSKDAAMAVGQGSAEAGIVYRTDAKPLARVRILLQILPDDREPITYILALLARSKATAARDFFHFLQGNGAAIFERHGFVVLAREKKP